MNSLAFRRSVSPLNPPSEDVFQEVRDAATKASTRAFRIGVLVAALLLFAGAAVNGVGVSNHQATEHAHADPEEDLPPGSSNDRELAPDRRRTHA